MPGPPNVGRNYVTLPQLIIRRRFGSARLFALLTGLILLDIYQFRFHPMLKYACVYCVRFVLNYSIVVNLGAGL